MAKINGNLLIVTRNGTALACQTSSTLDISSDMLDTTCKGEAPDRSFIPGLTDKTISVDGIYDPNPSSGTGIGQAIADIMAGTQVTVRFGETTSGGTYWTGSAYFENVSVTGDLNSPASFSATLHITGALTEGSVT